MLSMSADVEQFQKSCRFFRGEVRYRSTHGAAENGQRGHTPLLFQKPVFFLNHDSWTGGNYFFLSILESNRQIHQITLFPKMSMIFDQRSPSKNASTSRILINPIQPSAKGMPGRLVSLCGHGKCPEIDQ